MSTTDEEALSDETRMPLMLAAGRCRFCEESFADTGRLVMGGSGLICDSCVRAAARLLTDAQERKRAPSEIYKYLERHFAPRSAHEVVATSRAFPLRQQADLQRALDDLLGERRVPESFIGYRAPFSRDALSYAKLLEKHMPAEVAPPQYMEVEIGRGETVRCLKNGLWLLRDEDEPYAVVLSYTESYMSDQHLQLEVAVPSSERGIALATRLFDEIERRLTRGSCYRGRVLSLEPGNGRSGHAQRIQVHDLPPVEREALILPEAILEAIERNVLAFSRQRSALRALGMSPQKGLLFHGAPGVGKTHCIRYMAGQLEGHTTLLITAEQVGLLPEYMILARLLQPALVVIEDAALIAQERSTQAGGGILLNRLLNELDGLREQADVIFVLTTNNPQTLEPALVSRPGRIDQAIEFPLPDIPLRQRLVRLYARGLTVPEPLIEELARRTEGASPAFIKELMRRIAQHHLERGSGDVTRATAESALHEMLFSGGVLNRRLLGGPAIGFTSS